MSELPTEILLADQVNKTFRHRGGRSSGASDVRALRDVSLRVASGECLGIAGESGSGKSTLARILVGLETPTSGTVRIAGADFATARGRSGRRRHARSIQIVFQDPYSSLDPRQPVGDVLDEVQRVHFRRDQA